MMEKLSVRQGSSLDTLRYPLVIKSQNRERWEVEISVEMVVLSSSWQAPSNNDRLIKSLEAANTRALDKKTAPSDETSLT